MDIAKTSNSNKEQFWIEHLLRRAGFGYTPQERQYYKSLGYDGAVKELLFPEKVDNSALEKDIQAQNFNFTDLSDLKRWWIYRMAYSKRPLEEKITLFWHGHFATSNLKVHDPYGMYLQNKLLRAKGLGNFEDILSAISKDPAMITWLDNQQNKKGKPNENYAREIMELFTMGIGNYGEQDVKEGARAFTGWQTREEQFVFNANQHDFGQKSFLGITGNLNGEDIIKIVARKPATAHYLSQKLVRFFACDDPDPDMVDKACATFIKHEGDIKPVLLAIFTHPQFFSQKCYHAKIKSPAELVVGTIKTFQLKNLDADLPAIMSRMGQDLFAPPNVKGWDGGIAWISTGTLIERFNFAERVTAEKFDSMESYFSPAQMLEKQGLNSTGSVVNYFLSLLVDADVPESTKNKLETYLNTNNKGAEIALNTDSALDTKLRGLVRLIMTLPTFQLA